MKIRACLLALFFVIYVAADNPFKNSDGVLVEDPGTNNQDHNFFNKDNKIYLPGQEFIYSYTIKKNQKELYCRTNAVNDTDTKNWTLVNSDQIDDLTIKYIGFKVLPGYGGMDNLFPDFSQTVVQQQYWSSKMTLLFDGSTGLVENSANVWLHPFRGKYFSTTQLSPFPFIKFPLKKGESWDWNLEIDSRWSDPRIITYDGKLAAKYKYEFIDIRTIPSSLGNLECSVIEGIATNRLGQSKLRSYFNTKYGFVRLEYKNIDDSEINFELIKVLPAKN